MDRSGSFRTSVQSLVRETAARGASVTELTRMLRERHGRAYRRCDMLADLRRYRSPHGVTSLAARVSSIAAALMATARGVDHPRYIARAGVAVFAVSLLMPMIASDLAHGRGALVAGAIDVRASAAAEVSLPNQVAEGRRRMVTPAPTPEPTPAPSPAPLRLVPGGPGVLVTASWYGPGFYENRLPCWQWLQANGLPIQFMPDTLGVAHTSLPCGTMLVLTHGGNTVTVPVVDRGPYIPGRELDLSPHVRSALGCTDLCTVLMQLR